MIKQWSSQILAVIRLELKKTFFARRGLWIYLLAFAPVFLFALHSIVAPHQEAWLTRMAEGHLADTAALQSVQEGSTREEVVEKLGEPFSQRSGRLRSQGVRGDLQYHYTDGKSHFVFLFSNGKVRHIAIFGPETFDKESEIFATSFQAFFLRLAIFFGCVGVFLNLFRGEMLDKSLHFYLLAPMRREVLLAGKYLAGLLATVVIFTTSAGLQLTAMLWRFDHSVVAGYLAGPGWGQIFAYLAVTILACIGYGSVFVAAGMFFRNPIVPTVLVLVWEGANAFLPAALKKISLIFYLQALCPVVAPSDLSLPVGLKILIATAEPVRPVVAVIGILVFTLFVLAVAGHRARKLEINYSAD
jgi:ABC-type transport system involved in multi-copper enzyme maturation permease subunit